MARIGGLYQTRGNLCYILLITIHHNSTTFYQGYGADNERAHEWRKIDETAITYIDNLGKFSTQGYFPARFQSMNKSPSDYS